MAEGRHERSADARRRRNAIIIGAIVLGLLVLGIGYVLGTNGGETAESTTPTSGQPTSASPTGPSPTARPSAPPEPSGDELTDGRKLVRAHAPQGGGAAPPLAHYTPPTF